jgi:hypothetical protein
MHHVRALKDKAKSKNAVHKYRIAVYEDKYQSVERIFSKFTGVIGQIDLDKYQMKLSNVGEPRDG